MAESTHSETLTDPGASETKKKDLFRDTPVRYLGYANEIGEAFRSLVHVAIVRASYVVASGYVLADTCDKAEHAFRMHSENADIRRRRVTVAAVDSLVWQGLASVIIPGFTINRICFFSRLALDKYVQSKRLPNGARGLLTTLVGLACIPFIIKPIDHSTDWALDRTLRPFLNN